MKFSIAKRHIKKFFKRLGIGFLGLFLLFLLLNWFFPLPDKIEYSAIITDNKGEVINAYLTSDQKWRMKTELDEISPLLVKPLLPKKTSISILTPVSILLQSQGLFSKIFSG